jgi:hypothetical protein
VLAVAVVVVAEAAALTALAPVDATSLPPPQDASMRVVANNSVVIYVRMIYP